MNLVESVNCRLPKSRETIMKTVLTSTVVGLALLGSTAVLAESPTVLFVLDGSGSMWGQIEGRPKIEIARTVMGDLLTNLPDQTRAGLMSFGHNRRNDCEDIELLAPVGSDPQALVAALNRVTPMGRTPLTEAIRQATLNLRDHEGNISVVLVSDGEETCGGDPCRAARIARESGVGLRIHVIGFDVTPQETEQLTCVAEAGGGRYFQAANAQELTLALAEVRREVVEAPLPPPPPPAPVQVAQAQPAASGVLFEDRFERNDLGEMWEVINHDPNRMAVAGGKLLIVAGSGTLSDAPRNIVLLRQPIPDDFVVTAKMTMQVTRDNKAGLTYYVDDDTRLHFIIFGTKKNRHYDQSDGRHVLFAKRLAGDWDTIERFYYHGKHPCHSTEHFCLDSIGDRSLMGYSSTPEDWHFQIERRGLRYTARVSVDGKEWHEVGSHTIINRNGRLGFTVVAGDGNENPAEFDDFVVKGVE
jgi:Mg-chelatase subunit ChlD